MHAESHSTHRAATAEAVAVPWHASLFSCNRAHPPTHIDTHKPVQYGQRQTLSSEGGRRPVMNALQRDARKRRRAVRRPSAQAVARPGPLHPLTLLSVYHLKHMPVPSTWSRRAIPDQD